MLVGTSDPPRSPLLLPRYLNFLIRPCPCGRRAFTLIRVRASPGHRTRGVLLAGPLAIPVALGRGGILANKREGDGATPRGRFRLVRLWWRADRHPRPRDLAAGAPDHT